jgi:hypothetical protein
MSEVTVNAFKSKRGWEAKDVIDFDGPLKLTIHTYRMGQLMTYATVSKHADGSTQHIFGLGGGGDYSWRVVQTPARATAKTVSEQHAQVMARLPEIQALAKAWYEKHPRMGV